MLKDFEFGAIDSGIVITKYRGNSEIVKIPAYICDKPVTEIGDRCFRDCSIKTVIIPNTVKFIDDCAFIWCSNLKNVYIPNSVTSIGKDAFAYCSGLTSVTIPDSVKSIGKSVFFNCESLTSVIIGNGVTIIGDCAFWECCGLEEIKVDANNNYYSSLDGVLFDKNKTELIQYPTGNTRTSYDIPNSVTSIGNDAFAYCNNLTSVTIPESVTSIGELAFNDCKSLTSITIPDGVSSIGVWAFYGCENLTDIYILNRDCCIIDEGGGYITIPTKTTVHGFVGSAAEKYTNKHGNKFKEIK